MIVPGGGISLDGTRWVSCRPDFSKRPAIRAFQIRLTHEIVCPLIGKLSGTHDERYGAFRS